MCQMCMADTRTTQNNFILPAPPVGGLPISQDWLNRMKLIRDRTIPIILSSGKDISQEDLEVVLKMLKNPKSLIGQKMYHIWWKDHGMGSETYGQILKLKKQGLYA